MSAPPSPQEYTANYVVDKKKKSKYIDTYKWSRVFQFLHLSSFHLTDFHQYDEELVSPITPQQEGPRPAGVLLHEFQFVCSPSACQSTPAFPPQSKDNVSLISDSKLVVGVNLSVNSCLSFVIMLATCSGMAYDK